MGKSGRSRDVEAASGAETSYHIKKSLSLLISPDMEQSFENYRAEAYCVSLQPILLTLLPICIYNQIDIGFSN
jgi:hypothetical protein